MSFFRPWRRNLKPLGTAGGNPSVTDEVLAEGPLLEPGHVVPDFGLWNEERQQAVHEDMASDVFSDFDREGAAEDKVWDALGSDTDAKKSSPDERPEGSAD